MEIESLSEYDPVASFSDTEIAKRKRNNPELLAEATICLKNGNLIESELLFSLGKEPFDTLTTEIGRPVTLEELELNKEHLKETAQKTMDVLDELFIQSGGKFMRSQSGDVFDLHNWLQRSNWIRNIVFLLENKDNLGGLSPFGANDEVILSFCAIFQLNQAIWCKTVSGFDLAPEWFAGEVLKVRDLLHLSDKNKSIRENASKKASSAAAIRHKENNAIKKDVLAYYAEHEDSFQSMSSAAEKISKLIAPITYRTAYKWIMSHNRTKNE